MPADAAASLPSVSDLQQRIEMLEAELRARFSEQAALTSQLADQKSTYSERQVHQVATNEVLAAMAASPTDAQPIFDLIATRARDICGSYGVSVFEFDGAMMHLREPLQRDVFRMSVRACCLDRIKSGAAPAIDERHRFAIVSRNWRDVGFG